MKASCFLCSVACCALASSSAFGQNLPFPLVLTASGNPNPVVVSNTLVYTVTLTNTSAIPLNVRLSDTLPPAVSYIRAFVTGPSAASFGGLANVDNVVTTTNSNFGSNQFVSLTIQVTPIVTGILSNSASVSATGS